MQIAGYKIEPAADLFPMLGTPELRLLAEDIRERGLIQPIILHQGRVLDGRNRLAACELAGVRPRFTTWKPNGVTATELVISANLRRRHLSKSQQVAAAVRALDLLKKEAKERQRAAASRTNRALGRKHETHSAKVRGAFGKASERAASLFGVSPRYIEMGARLAKSAPDIFERVAAGDLKLSKAKSQLDARERRRDVASESRKAKGQAGFTLIRGDAEKCAEQIAPSSVAAVITDPPYEQRELGAYENLGRLAFRVLKPGGSLLCLTGQSYLPDVLNALCASGLEYHWTLAYLMAGNRTPKIFPRRVSASWKPILWFTKGKYVGRWIIRDLVRGSHPNERALHAHEQPEAGMRELVDLFTRPGDLILDPFCGSGTTGAAALSLAREFIGIDRDPKTIKVARQRLMASPHGLRSPEEERTIPAHLRDHKTDLTVESIRELEPSKHPAKYAPGLPTALVRLAGTQDIGDPFAGTGRLAEETELPAALNEIHPQWFSLLEDLKVRLGCELSLGDCRRIPWKRDTLIFSPPYYPRTDRRRQAGHDDAKRGSVVGYRSGYGGDGIEGFIGDPAGSDGITTYRNAMREVFTALKKNGRRMFVVVKNQTRLGVELRLDLDMILTANEAGWNCTARHGWEPKPSLWARYNLQRGAGIAIEDVIVFENGSRGG